MNLVLQISPKCGQGGGWGQKSQKFADVIYGRPLGKSLIPRLRELNQRSEAGSRNLGIEYLLTFVNDVYTVPVLRMAHRIWKETKLQPGTAGPGNMPGCCLISFHFPLAILSTSTVNLWKIFCEF